MPQVRTRGLKPDLWRWRPERLAPRWQAIAQDLVYVAPMWGGWDHAGLYRPGGRWRLADDGGGLTSTVDQGGMALDYDGTVVAYARANSVYSWETNGDVPLTMLGILSFDDLASDHAIGGGAGLGGGSWAWQCWMDAGNTNFAIATRTDGGTIQVADGGSPNTTDRFLVGISFDGVDAWNLWVDGVNLGSITEGSPDASGVSDNVLIGAAVTTDDKNHDGPYFANYFWTRELNAAEHQMLALDHYGLITPAPRRVFPVPAAVAQFLRPDADLANPDGWVNELGSSTDLYQSIDEEAADDSDWIEGP